MRVQPHHHVVPSEGGSGRHCEVGEEADGCGQLGGCVLLLLLLLLLLVVVALCCQKMGEGDSDSHSATSSPSGEEEEADIDSNDIMSSQRGSSDLVADACFKFVALANNVFPRITQVKNEMEHCLP